MSNWKEKMAAMLESNQKPSYDDLEDALAGALSERAAYEQSVREMAAWLGKIAAAFIKGDANLLADTVNAFVMERVRPAPTNPPLH